MSSFVDKVNTVCQGAEDTVDEITHTLGSITTMSSPLLATLASGLGVFYAIWDGLGKLIELSGGEYAQAISFVVAVVVTAGLEGASLGAVFNLDRTKAVNATRSREEQIEEGSLPVWTLVLSLALVVLLETIPTWVRFLWEEATAADLAFAFGLIALPFLGRIGALIYSQSRTLDGIDGAGERRQKQRSEREKQRLLDDIEIQRKRREVDVQLALRQAEGEAKIAARYAAGNDSGNGNKIGNKAETTTRKTVDERAVMTKMVRLYQEKGSLSNRKMGNEVGVSHTLVSDYVSKLADIGVLHIEGGGRSRTISVNGSSDKFLRGEL